MTFPKQVKYVAENMDKILAVKEVFTPELVSVLSSIASVDIDRLELLARSIQVIQQSSDKINTVVNGIDSIDKVLAIQNQVQHVSDSRNVISSVVGSMDAIRVVSDNISALDDLALLVPNIKEVMKMKPVIDEALMMKGEIELTSKIAESLRDSISKIEELQLQASNSAMLAADMVNKANIIEKRVDEKLKKVEDEIYKMETFEIEVKHVGSETEASTKYDVERNTLKLTIPSGKRGLKGSMGRGKEGIQGIPGYATKEGKPGEKGRDGNNGSNFKIDAFGKKRELAKYGNRPMGTSFLSLDEIPTMLYFRKSNALNDWTDGQAFGISDSETIMNAANSEKLEGYTLNEILSFIQKKIATKEL